MYIITGIGRSGTSFIAEMFHNMGHSMGSYNESIDAGFENVEVTEINKRIMSCEYVCNEVFTKKMSECAKSTKIAKDPRFLFTLGHWIRAEVNIDAVFYCTRNIEAIIESSEKTCAGNVALLHGFDVVTKSTVFASLEKGFWLLCGNMHIPIFEIIFPESLTNFEEVKCLSIVDNNIDVLREVWEKTKRTVND